MKNSLKWILLIAVIFAGAFYVSQNYYQLMLIQGSSMTPAYHNLQLVVLDKRYEADGLRAGDVIAFRCDGLNAVLVKRIAAVPGQSVVIKDGKLLVDGTVSSLYGEKNFEYSGLLDQEISVPENKFVVIGDNIAESKDSRYKEVGIVDIGDIIGRVK